ncbi:MAG: type II toxin-antitoxin system death-on-curing family toxin [Rhodothermaceae bacterium]|nr:type II toxin-antitoxin system death-on-curing family toxin [Rhodothermaceae bacterium]MYF39902.1 type II toxin-antitoxin system death-on-curing family toxin [Rhodothermaceae bacterium]
MYDALEGNRLALGTDPQILIRNDLLSALGRPYHDYHREIYNKATPLIHAIISNHPFVDGNKRTALYLTELLLQRSGYELDVVDLELFSKFVLVAKGEMDYHGLREWLKTVINPLA